MGKTLILGNNPDNFWIREVGDAEFISVPNIPTGRSLDMTRFVTTLPTDADCIAVDADSLDPSNMGLPLNLMLNIRLMLHQCRKSSLSNMLLVSDLGVEAYKGLGAMSMLLMTSGVALVGSENASTAVRNARQLTPAEYVYGFLGLIKIEPEEKVEGRHSIANEWGAEALYNVISGGVRSTVVSLKASSSLYFKYSNVAALDAEDVRQIVECRTPRYLTERIVVPDAVNYLLIDDEAWKGWDKVLNAMMPNARQDVWDQPVSSYEEISEEVRSKISAGYYKLIFLDLRMAGVAEDNVIKPEEFSGMRILKAIKKINRGIRVVMLTATNKAWNLKALLDAGADGYYMKESPEYHFTLKYTQQNALALAKTIEDCIRDSYLQHIVAQQRELDLPADSDLSYTLRNQLSIALSLILKAKSKADYAFAYISLEQVFEIATNFLVRPQKDRNGTRYYFTEDAQEQCRLYDWGKAEGYLQSSGSEKMPVWRKVAAIYYQLYGGEDEKFGAKAQSLIELRNRYIHPENGVKPVITRDDYKDLFNTIMQFLSVFK